MAYRSGHWRKKGSGTRYRVAPHFFHVDDQDCPGESDVHRRWKTLAYDKIKAVYEESHGLRAIHLDDRFIGGYKPDVLAIFDDADDRLGRGLAVEVQYRNENKDINRVEQAYLSNGFSVMWLEGAHFSDTTADLPDPLPAWPNGVPPSRPITESSHQDYRNPNFPRTVLGSPRLKLRLSHDSAQEFAIRRELLRLGAHIRVTKAPIFWTDEEPFWGPIRQCLGDLGFSQGPGDGEFRTTLWGAGIRLDWRPDDDWNRSLRYPRMEVLPPDDAGHHNSSLGAYVKSLQLLSCDRIGSVSLPTDRFPNTGFTYRLSLVDDPEQATGLAGVGPSFQVLRKGEISLLNTLLDNRSEDVLKGFCSCPPTPARPA